MDEEDDKPEVDHAIDGEVENVDYSDGEMNSNTKMECIGCSGRTMDLCRPSLNQITLRRL